MDEDYELDESDKLSDLVPVVSEPGEQDLLKDEVELLEHPVPVYQPNQLEVEDVTLLQSCQAWDGRKAVEKEVALQVLELDLFELGVDRISLLLMMLLVEELLNVDGLVGSLCVDASCGRQRDEGQYDIQGE